MSPGWIDLHAHVWYGGTDISIRPSLCGVERGVTTIVDAGSAGEANFHGFREYVIEPARERIKAFLNIGSIGLVACNRVSELIDMRSIDLDRTIAVRRGQPRRHHRHQGARQRRDPRRVGHDAGAHRQEAVARC